MRTANNYLNAFFFCLLTSPLVFGGAVRADSNNNSISPNSHFNPNANVHAHKTGIERVQELRFEQAIAGINQTLLTQANSEYAAVFDAFGAPNTPITIYIKEDDIYMDQQWKSQGKPSRILVEKFTSGGSINNKGQGVFDRTGRLSNIRFGASAQIKSNNSQGAYAGKATVRLIYQ